MARPLPDVMYGTPDGVALDQGAAESVRRLRQQGPQQVVAGRAPLRPVDASTGQYSRPTATVTPITPTTPTAPVTPTAPAAPSLRQRAGVAAGSVGDALRQAGPAMAGFGAAAGVNTLRQNQLDNAPAMPAPGEAAPGQIPVDTRYAAPPAAAGSLLSQSELGRNVGNALMATPLGSGASASLRAGAGMVRAGAPIATAANLATIGSGVARGYAAGDAANPGVSSKAPVLGPTPSIRQPFSDVRNGTYGDGMPDLTGKIVRDGNSYSGKDVKFGAEIVNPRNPGVGVSSLDTSEGYRQNLLELQRNAANAQAPGGVVGIGPRGGGNVFDDLRAKNPTVPATRAERMAQAELANRAQIAEAQTGATLRGQDITAGTSRANTRDTVGASLRGQDMDYAEKMDSKRLDLAAREAQRRAISSAWQGTTDPGVAAARLAASGYDPASALAVASGQRASAEASDKNFRNITEAAGATTDKDGKPVLNPALQAVAQNVIANAMPGVRNAAPANQNARLREVQATGSLAAGLQEAQGGSLLQTLGIDKAPPAVSTLPNFQGATLRERGIGSPFANASRGDYELVQPDGTVAPIKRGRVSERELDYMKQQGVSLRN